jgi:ferric citrate transport system substrate-binding protein
MERRTAGGDENPIDRAIARRTLLRGLGAGALGLGAGGIVSACSAPLNANSASGSAAGHALTISDAIGSVRLPRPAKRVAVQEWQFCEDLLALGVKPVMVADDQGFGQPNPLPPQVKNRLGHYTSLGSRLSPNMEVLASHPVDLIIVDKNEQAKNYSQFAKIAPTMVLDTDSWSAFYPNLQKIAEAVGKSAQGAQVEQSIKRQFASAKSKLHSVRGVRALIAVPNSTGFFPFTDNSPQAGVMTSMGLGYAYPAVPGELTVQIGLQALPPLEPGAMFLAPVPDEPTLITDTWQGDPLWTDLPAVKAHRVFTVDRSIWSVGRGALAIPLMISQTVKLLGAR